MADSGLDYSCIGEGTSTEETVEDFKRSYEGMKDFSVSTDSVATDLKSVATQKTAAMKSTATASQPDYKYGTTK